MSDFGTVELFVYIVGLIGGANWLLTSGFDVNLVTQAVGSGNAELAYTVVGVVSVAALLDALDVVDLMEILP